MTDTVELFMSKLNHYLKDIDDNGRMYLKAQSDSTAIFLFEMLIILNGLECTDIQTKGYPAPADKIPKDKPWCSWIDEASGVLPEKFRKYFKRKDTKNEKSNQAGSV